VCYSLLRRPSLTFHLTLSSSYSLSLPPFHPLSRPLSHPFSIIFLTSCTYVRHSQEALSVLTSIKKRGLAPDHFTFTTLLMACGRTGNSDKVRYTLCLLYLLYLLHTSYCTCYTLYMDNIEGREERIQHNITYKMSCVTCLLSSSILIIPLFLFSYPCVCVCVCVCVCR
jgi:hypothetical protein